MKQICIAVYLCMQTSVASSPPVHAAALLSEKPWLLCPALAWKQRVTSQKLVLKETSERTLGIV